MSGKLLDTKETLQRLHISRTTLYQWMEQGILTPVDIYPAQFKRRPLLKFREEDVEKLQPSESLKNETQEETSEPENKVA